MRTDYRQFIEALESAGEDHVSLLLSSSKWADSDPEKKWVSDWLQSKSDARRDARLEEAISIAKEDNRIASKALEIANRVNRSRWKDRTITIIAIIIAVIAAHEEIMWLINVVISLFSN